MAPLVVPFFIKNLSYLKITARTSSLKNSQPNYIILFYFMFNKKNNKTVNLILTTIISTVILTLTTIYFIVGHKKITDFFMDQL